MLFHLAMSQPTATQVQSTEVFQAAKRAARREIKAQGGWGRVGDFAKVERLAITAALNKGESNGFKAAKGNDLIVALAIEASKAAR